MPDEPKVQVFTCSLSELGESDEFEEEHPEEEPDEDSATACECELCNCHSMVYFGFICEPCKEGAHQG